MIRPTDEQYVDMAHELYVPRQSAEPSIRIDGDAEVNRIAADHDERGAWVSAWVWVARLEVK
jgi:hypothetical protein